VERRYSSYSFSTSALDGGEWSASRPGRALAPGEGPQYPCIGGLVGPRVGLDTEATRKSLSPLPGIEPRSPGRPARSQTLYWLSYPVHCHIRTLNYFSEMAATTFFYYKTKTEKQKKRRHKVCSQHGFWFWCKKTFDTRRRRHFLLLFTPADGYDDGRIFRVSSTILRWPLVTAEVANGRNAKAGWTLPRKWMPFEPVLEETHINALCWFHIRKHTSRAPSQLMSIVPHWASEVWIAWNERSQWAGIFKIISSSKYSLFCYNACL
jgi:hypothetical protein